MKSVYTIIDNTVYRIVEHVSEPTELSTLPAGNSAALNISEPNRDVTQIVKLNTLKREHVISNAQLVKNMITKLKTDKTTEINTIQNFFKIYVDYTVYQNGREIDHSGLIRPVEPIEKAILLGVSKSNELVYRRVKYFDHLMEFGIKNSLPFGIMRNANYHYSVRINAIAVFQGTDTSHDYHASEYCNSYKIPSASIDSDVKDMLVVYNTENENIAFDPIELSYLPRKLAIKLELVLSDYAVVYDDSIINTVLADNIAGKYDDKPTDPTKPSTPEAPITPGDDIHTPADGKEDPDRNGWFDFYERCTETSPHRLLVVEDDIPSSKYDSDTMIKKSNVVKDVSDIKVGEYVVYREAFVVDDSL